jgi:hypothetical protein
MRLANRVPLTSDGHKAYLEAVEGAFGADVNYAQLVKLYGATSESTKGAMAGQNALALTSNRWRAILIRSTFRPAMQGILISAFGCTPAALLG